MMSDNRLAEEDYSWRKGDWVFTRLGAVKVDRLNREVTKVHQEVRDRIGINRTESPPISQQIMVFNVALRECYLVFVYRVNCVSVAPPRVESLVKLSPGRFAPHRARALRLATPAYYRKSESANSEPTDPHDGCLTKDATPWARQVVLRTAGSFIHDLSASLTLSSFPDEPWVYCTSIAPTSDADTRRLRARFPRYDAITSIRAPESFAMQLGIDFAISVDKSKHVELGPINELAYRRSWYTVGLWEGEHQIDKFIRVYHGPVVYEDHSGALESMEDFVDFSMVPQGWFTKKTRFSGEQEYRFAVSALGRPRTETFKLRISDELRMFTASPPGAGEGM